VVFGAYPVGIRDLEWASWRAGRFERPDGLAEELKPSGSMPGTVKGQSIG
jgi:hypothetical protein